MAASKPTTATNVIDQNALNDIVEFLDISAYDSVAPAIISTGSEADGTPPSAITSATQRIGETVHRIKPVDVAASVTISFVSKPSAGEIITFVTADGTSQEFECTASTTSATQFGRDGSKNGADKLKTAIEASSIASKLLVGAVLGSSAPYTIKVSQVTSGAAGNKLISSNLDGVSIDGVGYARDGTFSGGVDGIRIHENFGTGGSRIGQTTVFGEYSDTRNIDHLRQGKNVADLKHFVKGTLPFISVNTGNVLCGNDGRVKHQMVGFSSFGQSSLYKVFDDRKRKLIPFEDFPGKLDPVALVDAGDYILQYMIVTDLTRDIDKFINPDTMDGVIEVFEIRRQFANTNFADIQINGIRCDLSTGDWNFDQKGSSIVDTKYEKKQSVCDYFEDAQDTLFAGNIYDFGGTNWNLSGSFRARQGYSTGSAGYFAHDDKRFQEGSTGSFDRYFALPGWTSDGYYGIAPFDDTENYISSSYEHVLFELSLEPQPWPGYDLTKNMDWFDPSADGGKGRQLIYRKADSLVGWWRFDNSKLTGTGSADVDGDGNVLTGGTASEHNVIVDLSGKSTDLVLSGNLNVSRPNQFSSDGIGDPDGYPSKYISPGTGSLQFGSVHTQHGESQAITPQSLLTGSKNANAQLSFGDGSDNTAFTMAFWIRFPQTVVTAGVPNFGDSMNIIFGKHQYVPNLGTNSKAEWHFETNSSRAVVLQLWDESAALSTSYHQNITPSAEAVKDITATSWTHFVFTYNGSSDASGMEIYVNGVKDEGASIQSHSNFVAMETLNIPISVGGALNDSPGQTSQTSPNRDFYGNIAEIAIWRHEDEREILNADTIKLLYQAGSDSTKFENTTPATRAMNNVLTSSFFDISDIGSRFTSCNTGFIFGKNIVSASNMSGINNHLGVDSIAFGGLLK